ncbi:MAG: SAM-dependent chlorinase/fluorinase [Bacteroidota bacterium]
MAKTDTRLVTLTTDWGNQDYYLGMLCGKLYSVSPKLHVVELSHKVPPYNYRHAAFLIKHSFRFFPPGSIHICMVNSDTSDNMRMLFFEYQEHSFIVPDNGTISLITDNLPEIIHGVPVDDTRSFGSLDSVALAVEVMLSENGLTDFAIEVSGIKKFTPILPLPENDSLTGSVIYIDSYLNAITNITRDDFEAIRKSRKYTIYVQSYSHGINKLSNSYKDVEKGDLLALFNTLGLLEIAVREGFASQMYNLNIGSNIMVRFYDDDKLLR